MPRPARPGSARLGSGGGAARCRGGAARVGSGAGLGAPPPDLEGGRAREAPRRFRSPVTPCPLCPQVVARPAAREPPAARCATASSPRPSRGARDPPRPPPDGRPRRGTCGEERGATLGGVTGC